MVQCHFSHEIERRKGDYFFSFFFSPSNHSSFLSSSVPIFLSLSVLRMFYGRPLPYHEFFKRPVFGSSTLLTRLTASVNCFLSQLIPSVRANVGAGLLLPLCMKYSLLLFQPISPHYASVTHESVCLLLCLLFGYIVLITRSRQGRIQRGMLGEKMGEGFALFFKC